MKYLSLLIVFTLPFGNTKGQGVFDNTLHKLNLSGKVKTIKTIRDHSIIDYSLDSFDINGYRIKTQTISREDVHNEDTTPVEQHPFIIQSDYQYFYNADYHLIKETDESYDDTDIWTSLYYYDTKGRLCDEQYFENKDTAHRKVHYFYDEKDSVIIETSIFYYTNDSGINHTDFDTIRHRNKIYEPLQLTDAILLNHGMSFGEFAGEILNFNIAATNGWTIKKRFGKGYALEKVWYDNDGELAGKIWAGYDRHNKVKSQMAIMHSLEIHAGGSRYETCDGVHESTPGPPPTESIFKFRTHTRYLKYDKMHNWILKIKKRSNGNEVTRRLISYYE